MKKEDMSCIDCAVKNCNKMDKTYPDFCLTTHMDEEVLNEAMECYNEDENRKVTIAAAEVEYENYCKHTRVEEIMDFAKKINAKKIGIATNTSYMEANKPCNSGSFIRQYMQFLSHSRRSHSRRGKNSILLLFLKYKI